MKRTRKRIICILAAAAVSVCLLPQHTPLLLRSAVAASAAETNGTCGENVTWTLKDGVLTISGTGPMKNYYYDVPANSADSPFFNYPSEIRKVVIQNGVTTIGNALFTMCSSLTEITIPSSVTSIGDDAFFRCTGLTEVTIPDSVTSIGAGAFYECTGLTEITVPESVTRIGRVAFRNTPWMNAILEENPIVILNGILLDETVFEGDVTLPDSIKIIGESALSQPSSESGRVTSVVIPDSVTSICARAFSRCESLTSLTIPDSVTSIGEYAFNGCIKMTSVTIPESVTSIGKFAFMRCYNLTIQGKTGSAAETFANENEIPFESLGETSEGVGSDWAEKSVISKNTKEAELVVRVGDIDACNDENAVADHGYDPFTAKSQYAHGYPWLKDETDPAGTDRIFVGSKWNGEATDGYASNYAEYKNGNDEENAFGEGALSFTMEYDASEIEIDHVILQLCIDDFQANSWDSVFTVTLNGKDAPFIAELLNHTDQTGPTAHIVSAMIPSGFFADIASGNLTVVIDETTGIGDGYAIDFARLLINYDDQIFTGTFSGKTEPGATVRLLGTSTTVTAASDGSFTFNAIPGINAVRASKTGFAEKYDSGIVLSAGTEWKPALSLEEGKGSPDIDFSKFAETGKPLKGDYNGDKEITVADAVLLARFVSEDTTLTEEEIYKILIAEPDYDDDGLVTILDVTALMKTLGEA